MKRETYRLASLSFDPAIYYFNFSLRVIMNQLHYYALHDDTTVAALLENNEASAKLTTANGGTFTLSSARLSSQSRYSTLDQ